AVQVRARSLEPDALATIAAQARAEVPANVPLLLNGPPDLAAALGYDGVHYPQAAIPVARPPALRWTTAAVHDLDAVARAGRAGIDAMVFGAVFDPGSHAGTGGGLEALRAACDAASRPVIAIGGISPERVEDCARAGAAGVAVVSGVIGDPDPAAAVARYCEAWEAAEARLVGQESGR
ncbi:MAG: thiamine phosphate synthase, partial [Dehalococcoidia bacterium]